MLGSGYHVSGLLCHSSSALEGQGEGDAGGMVAFTRELGGQPHKQAAASKHTATQQRSHLWTGWLPG